VSRYAKDHKASTRRAILEASGRRLKLDGIDGSGVATLMKDAGLTNGAFYAHFASKADLVAATIADQLDAQRAMLRSVLVDRHGIEAFIRSYLSPAMRDDRGGGCPSAALLDEIARCSDTARAAYRAGLTAIVDDIAAVLEPGNPASALRRTWGTMVLLIGALQMARALDDPDLSDDVLDHGIDSALRLLGLSHAGDVDEPSSTG
jgi:TetR/AcrR family transcriptional regulator, transcriptional repressor for nem operon